MDGDQRLKDWKILYMESKTCIKVIYQHRV